MPFPGFGSFRKPSSASNTTAPSSGGTRPGASFNNAPRPPALSRQPSNLSRQPSNLGRQPSNLGALNSGRHGANYAPPRPPTGTRPGAKGMPGLPTGGTVMPSNMTSRRPSNAMSGNRQAMENQLKQLEAQLAAHMEEQKQLSAQLQQRQEDRRNTIFKKELDAIHQHLSGQMSNAKLYHYNIETAMIASQQAELAKYEGATHKAAERRALAASYLPNTNQPGGAAAASQAPKFTPEYSYRTLDTNAIHYAKESERIQTRRKDDAWTAAAGTNVAVRDANEEFRNHPDRYSYAHALTNPESTTYIQGYGYFFPQDPHRAARSQRSAASTSRKTADMSYLPPISAAAPTVEDAVEPEFQTKSSVQDYWLLQQFFFKSLAPNGESMPNLPRLWKRLGGLEDWEKSIDGRKMRLLLSRDMRETYLLGPDSEVLPGFVEIVLSQLPRLYALNMEGSPYTFRPSALDSVSKIFSSLKTINFSNTLIENAQLSALVDSLENPNTVEYINLSWCRKLTNLDALGRLHRLKQVHASGLSGLKDISWVSHCAKHLQELDVSRCDDLTNYTPIIQLRALLKLYVSCVDGQDLKWLHRCEGNLQELYLSHANLVVDIKPLGSLLALKKVLIAGSGTLDLSPLSTCIHLEELYLSDCDKLTDMRALSNLRGLKKLFVISSKPVNLSWIAKCVPLEELYICDCDALVEMKPLTKLTRLKVLQLRGLGVAEAAAWIGGCKSLTEIALMDCEKTVNLDGLHSLTNLKRMILHGLGINTVSWIEGCTGLEELEISDCPGVSDVACLKSLPRLRHFYCCDNAEKMDFSWIPESKTLVEIALSGNLLSKQSAVSLRKAKCLM